MIKHFSLQTSSLWALLLLLQTSYALKTVEFSTLDQAEQTRVMEYYSNTKGTKQFANSVTFLQQPCVYLQDSPEKFAVAIEITSKDPEGKNLEPDSQSKYEKYSAEIEKVIQAAELYPQSDGEIQITPRLESARLILNVISSEAVKQLKIKNLEERIKTIDEKYLQSLKKFFDIADKCILTILDLENEKNVKSIIEQSVKKYEKGEPNISWALKDFCKEFHEDFKKTLSEKNINDPQNPENLNFRNEIKALIEQNPATVSDSNVFRPELFNPEYFMVSTSKRLMKTMKSEKNNLFIVKREIAEEIKNLENSENFYHLILVEFQKFNRLLFMGMDESENPLLSKYRLSNQFRLYANLVSLWKALAEKGLRQCNLNLEPLRYRIVSLNSDSEEEPKLDYIPLLENFDELNPVNKPCPYLPKKNEFFSVDEHFPRVFLKKYRSERFGLYSLAYMISSLEVQLISAKIGEIFKKEENVPDDLIFENLFTPLKKIQFDISDPKLEDFLDVLVSKNQQFNQEIKEKIQKHLYDQFSIENRKQFLNFSVDLLFEKIKSFWRMSFIQKGVAVDQVENLIQPFDTLSSLINGMINGEFGYDEAISQLQALAQSASKVTLNLRDRELRQQPPRDRGTVIIRI